LLKSNIANVQRAMSYPVIGRLVSRFLKTTGKFLNLPPDLEVFLNTSARPSYAYCVYHAAELACRLNLKRISVLEFGVAGGNGLLFLERFAKRVETAVGVQIEVYGFDTGGGLPRVTEPEDLPYWFQSSQYKMQVAALESERTSATLVLGDVKDTVGDFFAKYKPAPVGAILNDLDLYSSTSDSLKLFDGETANFLPRVFLYFDDIVGSEYEMYGDCNGQLLAISEYNERSKDVHIGLNQNLLPKTEISYRYQIYYAHLRKHSMYGHYVGGREQLRIESDLQLQDASKHKLNGRMKKVVEGPLLS
jgi:hypothetical protein